MCSGGFSFAPPRPRTCASDRRCRWLTPRPDRAHRFANETMDMESGCFVTEALNYTIMGNFTGNLSKGDFGLDDALEAEELAESGDGTIIGRATNMTLGGYAWCCLNNHNASTGFGSSRRLQGPARCSYRKPCNATGAGAVGASEVFTCVPQ